MLRPLAEWLAATPLSKTLQDQPWVIPTSQSIHILGIAVVFASACMINLRLLGVGVRGRSVPQLTKTLVPWMWCGLLVLLLTGTVQTLAEPEREFVAPLFWAKLAMIVIVVTMTAFFARAVRANASAWDAGARRPAAAIFAIISLLLWLAIITCGRFIAYTYSLYS